MCLCSVEAAEDGQVRSCPAGHSDAGAARSRQSRPALLLALLHLRRARSRTLRTNRSDRGFHFNKWSESFDERPHCSPRLPLFPGCPGPQFPPNTWFVGPRLRPKWHLDRFSRFGTARVYAHTHKQTIKHRQQ